MIRFRFAPLVLAIFALAACNKSSDSTAPKAAGPVAAVAPPAGSTWAEQIVETAEGVRMGNPNAPIQLVEYGSYTCPHCRDFQSEAHEAIEGYVNSGKLSFEYRNMIRDPIDLTVALIAHCAPPASYFALNTQLFGNQVDMITAIQGKGDEAYKAAASAPPEQRFVRLAELSNLIDFAKARGVPEAQLRTCLANVQKAQGLAEISQKVTEKYPTFAGTPSFLINGTLLDATANWATLQPKLHDAGV